MNWGVRIWTFRSTGVWSKYKKAFGRIAEYPGSMYTREMGANDSLCQAKGCMLARSMREHGIRGMPCI